MGGNKTNSNSITSILVEKLNNRKSGFRYIMIKEWNSTIGGATLGDDTFFVDGTYRKLPFDEMGDCRVDIVGYSGGKEEVLIEIKAGCKEELQYSQIKNGVYDKTASKYRLKLFFIIPDKYEHQNNLPVNPKNYKWSEIYNIALEYDNTGLADQIKFFVEKTLVPEKLKEGEVITCCEPTTIENVLGKYKRIKGFMGEFVKRNKDLIKYDNRRGKKHFGMHYKIINPSNKQQVLEDVWIGLLSLEDFIKQKFPYIYRDQTLQEIATDNDFFIWFGFYDNDEKYSFNEGKTTDLANYYKIPWNDGEPGHDYFFTIKTAKGTSLNFSDTRIDQEEFYRLLENQLHKILNNHITFK